MLDQELGFLIKVYFTSDVAEILRKLNQILGAEISFDGGEYKNNYISIEIKDFFDAAKPVDFDNYNYPFDMFVDFAMKNEINESIYIEQVKLAQKFEAAFVSIGCTVEVIFTFMFPDGSDPTALMKTA